MNIKKILKSVLNRMAVLLFLAILAILGCKIVAYFETANQQIDDISYLEKEEMLHQPLLRWSNKTDVLGNTPLEFQLQDIEKAYKYAWYRLNKSIKTNNNYGLKDYFSDSLAMAISQNFSSEFAVNQIDLTHNLNLHLFSFDEIIVVFKDENIVQRKEINSLVETQTENSHSTAQKKYPKLLYQQTDTLTFDVVMKLTDGRWKIIEMVKKPNLGKILNPKATQNAKIDTKEFANIKGINYYPAKSPWFYFWQQFNAQIIEQDFTLIQQLGYNTVRIFVPFFRVEQQEQTGYSTQKMNTLLQLAKAKNLRVIPTLFDFPHSFDLDYYTAALRYIDTVAMPFTSNSTIYAWDLKNEPDLDFEYHNPRQVLAFLDFSIDYLHQIGVQQPITLGWMKAENAHLLKTDFTTFHYYDSPENFEKTLQILTQKTTKPIMLGEFGYSSFAFWGNNEQAQQNYIAEINQLCAQNNIPTLVWTLHDFEDIPKGVFENKPWIEWKQSKFGVQ